MDEWYPDPYEWPEDPYPFRYEGEDEDESVVCVSCGLPVVDCSCVTSYDDY